MGLSGSAVGGAHTFERRGLSSCIDALESTLRSCHCPCMVACPPTSAWHCPTLTAAPETGLGRSHRTAAPPAMQTGGPKVHAAEATAGIPELGQKPTRINFRLARECVCERERDESRAGPRCAPPSSDEVPLLDILPRTLSPNSLGSRPSPHRPIDLWPSTESNLRGATPRHQPRRHRRAWAGRRGQRQLWAA